MLRFICHRRHTKLWTAAVSIAGDPLQLDELAADRGMETSPDSALLRGGQRSWWRRLFGGG